MSLPAAPLLQFRNATVYRGDRAVLNGLTLSVAMGEHVAILGPNGCGKSTLIKTITRECYPRPTCNGAALRILGRETWNVFELRMLLGIVTNDLMQSCARDFTGREIVLSGFFSSVGIWPHHVVTPEMERRADDVLGRLEIPHLGSRWVDEMSSGEARRILIARALVHDPKALVLDEPGNSLDLHAIQELRTVMRKLADAGVTIVLVTHHLAEIIPEIRRVILLQDGRVFCDGPKEQVLRPDLLADLFHTRVELLERDGYYHLL
jgi:iron complex transport system ATP-binding protein